MASSEVREPPGRADLPGLNQELSRLLETDPDLSFQIAAFARGRLILDAGGGSHLNGDSLIVPFSVSKNAIGVSVGLLVERGQLDLDALVASYWPGFAQAGKGAVTVPRSGWPRRARSGTLCLLSAITRSRSATSPSS